MASEAEVALDKICVHIQMVDLRIHPRGNIQQKYGFTQYYCSGKLVTMPREVWHESYDAVKIRLAPDPDRSLKELEKLICHELVHVAFPRCGETEAKNMENFFGDPIREKWIENKTAQLLKKYGYVFKIK